MKQDMNDQMEIRLIGGGISPATIRASELADIIKSIEESVVGMISSEYPEQGEAVVFGLVSIQEGSARLGFCSSLPAVTLAAFITISGAISANNYSKLPIRSIKAVKAVADFARRKQCVAEFRVHGRPEVPVAQLTAASEVPIPAAKFLSSKTTIYGRVERIGGATPKVSIRLPQHDTLICDIAEQQAIELARHLYGWVGIAGEAKWAADTLTIDQFSVDSITNYTDQPVTASMKKLSAALGKYWLDVPDVLSAVQKIRRGDD